MADLREEFTTALENLQLEVTADEEGNPSWEVSDDSIRNTVEYLLDLVGGEDE
jgi:hypothetical protein